MTERRRAPRACALALLVACGGAHRPATPAFDAPALAAELDAELAELARILHVRRDDCPTMARELRAVFARMRVSIAHAHEAQRDPERATQLTTAMRAYDARARERDRQIDLDFTPDAPCATDAAVREVLVAMPTL